MNYIIIKVMYCSTKRNFFIRTVYSVKIGTNIELNRAAPINSVIRFYEYHMRSSRFAQENLPRNNKGKTPT